MNSSLSLLLGLCGLEQEMVSNFCCMDISELREEREKPPKHNFNWGETLSVWGAPGPQEGK